MLVDRLTFEQTTTNTVFPLVPLLQHAADFLDSCRANTLLAELDDEEDLPEPDDDDDENEDDNQEDQEYEEVLVRDFLLFMV